MASELEKYINEQVLVSDVLEKLGYRRDPNKENYYYNHERGETKASISVEVKGNYCNDFGDADFPSHPVKLVMRFLSLSEHDAIDYLAKEFDVSIPSNLKQGNGESEELLRIRRTQKDYVKRCHNKLLSHDAALSSLLQKRGWKKETIKEQQIGFDDYIVPQMMKAGVSKEDLVEAGLHSGYENKGTMHDMIICPMFDKDGKSVLNVVAFARTSIDKRKNHNPKGLPLHLYNLPATRQAEKEGYILLCEGLPDTITAVDRRLTAVGVPGAGTFKKEWIGVLQNIPVVVAVFDRDKPGDKGLKEVVKALGNKCRILRLPNPDNVKGYDLSDYLNSHSVDDFMELVKEAMEFTPTMLAMKESIPKDVSKLQLSTELKPYMVGMSKMLSVYITLHLDFIETYFNNANKEFIKSLEKSIKEVGRRKNLWVPEPLKTLSQ